MTNPLTVHLVDLAENLADLRRRFRRAARTEVAQAVGEALRELARTMICGPARSAKAPLSRYSSAWDDPWQEPAVDSWQWNASLREAVERDETARPAPRWQSAALAGLTAARWALVRTRQLAPAVLIGLVVALAAYVGGPTIEALLDAWSSAIDLLPYPGPDQRP
jgi:hypothetical protein